MRTLRILPQVDPRSYKITRILAKHDHIIQHQALYSRALYSDFYSRYAGKYHSINGSMWGNSQFGASVSRQMNRISMITPPFSVLLGNRISILARKLGADLIHTNGPPDILGYLSREYSNLPVIHEIYDTISLLDFCDRRKKRLSVENNPVRIMSSVLYRNRELFWESYVHRRCSGLVFTSDEMMQASHQFYGDFDGVVVPNAMPHEFFPRSHKEKLSARDGKIHCVYVGAIRTGDGHRDIRHIASKLVSSTRLVLHVYPVMDSKKSLDDFTSSFAMKSNLVIHQPLHYSILAEELTQYDLGLVLLNRRDERLLEVALPNKVFEYVASGLPVAVPGYRSLRNFVKRFNCGFEYSDLPDDIESNQGRLHDISFQEEFTLDFYTPRLLNLYRRALA